MLAVVGRRFSQEPERRPVKKEEQMTWKRVNKKLKRILKRREIKRLKKEINSGPVSNSSQNAVVPREKERH